MIWEGLLLDCDKDLVGRFSDKVMWGEVESEGSGSVFGSDLSDCVVMGLCCFFSLSRLL